MKKLSVTFIVLLISVFFSACDRQAETGEPASYVDPFIGTGGHGHTYPGATVPFGMVQLSPQMQDKLKNVGTPVK